MTKKMWWVGLGIFATAGVLSAFFLASPKLNNSKAIEVDWRLLGEFDYLASKSNSERLSQLDSQFVRIPGFMVPLEDSSKIVTEFLLVPTPQACIHVPPPPPNQMVLVRMSSKAESQASVAYGPIWVYGRLKLTTKKTMYGDSSFELLGDSIEPYKY